MRDVNRMKPVQGRSLGQDEELNHARNVVEGRAVEILATNRKVTTEKLVIAPRLANFLGRFQVGLSRRRTKSAIRLEPRASKSVGEARSQGEVGGNQTRTSRVERDDEWWCRRRWADADNFENTRPTPASSPDVDRRS